MKIRPLNNIVLAELVKKSVEESASAIHLPEGKIGRFVKLKILAIGNLVENIKVGDEVWANPMFEIIDPKENTIGFINSKDILGVIE